MDLDKLHNHIEKTLAEHGFVLVEMQAKDVKQDGYLRVFIEHQDVSKVVGIDDCAKASRLFREDEELEDSFQYPFCFEVSSPGINRSLHTDKDFQRFVGEPLKVKLDQPYENKKVWQGDLIERNTDYLVLQVDDKRVEIPRDLIIKVNIDK